MIENSNESFDDFAVPPNNYLVWGILTTIFCCLPFGIVSIVKASNVNSLWFQGKREEAYKAANDAKKFAIISAVVTLVGVLLYFVFFAAVGFAAILEPYNEN
jgi:hypothetical protein